VTFTTPLTSPTPQTLQGPLRSPVQLLADQTYDDHLSVHDEATAGTLGLAGAPIEGPTHFSQFDPIGFEWWGPAWFETGCISAHFSTMVVEGEQVEAKATRVEPNVASIEAYRLDGTQVLNGSLSIAPHPQTALEERLATRRDAGELFVVDTLSVGMTLDEGVLTSMDHATPNGPLYPFSLERKLGGITERTPWYESADNPWGRPIVPKEMLSVLANKVGSRWPVREPSLGLFLDLEVRTLGQPVFVDAEYAIHREIVGLSQSRRVESYWSRTTLTDTTTGEPAATMLLHSGVFKESWPDYPVDRL